ncbi:MULTISPECIES: hypothetical protein [unclassified Streptomyces]|uniref:SLAC1 family transporter n=1 Tax=unclassified Streptomyces TaxID=2593676 RepID=UPI002E8021B5|nr:hypothetical protein [Streptomyces sp. NBC_00589]
MSRRTVRWDPELPAAAGAAAMATGIVSVGLQLAGHRTLSLIALAVDMALWLLLATAFTNELLRHRDRWTAQAATPPALTAVAATTVLGTRLSLLGWQEVAAALLAMAALVWPLLLVDVLWHEGRRMPGAVFLICVATQGLAVLCGRLSAAEGGTWLGWAALVFFCLGLPLYGVALAHFDFRQVYEGTGDQWVAGQCAGHLGPRRVVPDRFHAVDRGARTPCCGPPRWCSLPFPSAGTPC